MVRIFLYITMLLLPTAVMAQSNWELPKEQQKTDVSKNNKNTKSNDKKDKYLSVKDTNTGKTYTINEADRPYLKGAVPEIDGQVIFSKEINTKGISASEAYEKLYSKLESLTKDKNQTERSKIAIVNKKKHSIVATFEEWLVFTDKIFVLDRAKFNYVLIADCFDGKVNISISRLSYEYGEGKNSEHLVAEKLITDKLMLTNEGTKLKNTNKKYRKATVNRINEVLSFIESSFK